ncbi:MAG TPA: TraR/DksA family transcriptional regulator, partial [Limnochordales bacterium]
MGVSARLRRVLTRRLRRLEGVLDGRERQLQAGGLEQSLSDSLGEISRYDQHTADLGSETFERGKDIALRDRVRQRLQEVRRALARMEQGSYGRCESCGAFVGLGRLLAVPYACRCARCQE